MTRPCYDVLAVTVSVFSESDLKLSPFIILQTCKLSTIPNAPVVVTGVIDNVVVQAEQHRGRYPARARPDDARFRSDRFPVRTTTISRRRRFKRRVPAENVEWKRTLRVFGEKRGVRVFYASAISFSRYRDTVMKYSTCFKSVITYCVSINNDRKRARERTWYDSRAFHPDDAIAF